MVDEFTDGVLAMMSGSAGLPLGEWDDGPFEAVHANYWLSGLAGHAIKHELNLPLVSTFHTLDRVKAEAGPEEVEADTAHRRAEAEAAIVRCSDAVLASCTVEAEQIAQLYGADGRGSPWWHPGSTTPSSGRATSPGPPGPGAPRRRHPPALRRPHPAAQGRGPGGAHPGRAGP